jgi:CheY-like chemotaxis protein
VALVPVARGTSAEAVAGAVLIGADEHIDEATRAVAAAILAPPVSGRTLLSAIEAAREGAAPNETVRDDPVPRASSVPHVLIADDNATNRLLLEKMLGGPDWSLELVADGAQAVAAYAARRPDLVLMDISMPVMDGFEALAAIQAAEEEAGQVPAPILALTAYTGEEMTARLAEAGFAAHQTKPVRKPALVQAMRAAIGLAGPPET